MDPLVPQIEGIELSQSARQPALGKSYYQVFPKNGVDISKTSGFIKQTVGAEDLSPWTDVKNQLMHWTVEASPEEVSQLQDNTDIDHVDEIHLPAPPATTRRIRDTSAVEGQAERLEPVGEYLVFAKDGKNRVETTQTEEFLRKLVGEQNVEKPLIFQNEIRYWLCTMTTSQRDVAAKGQGVKSAEENLKGGYGSA